MWHMLEKITEQVTKYSNFLGQLWYILVFVFRLIVVVTIGGSVYGDEQSAFKCSTDVVGCQNICYNEFAKISHMRFWAFQLLAIATPTVFFHFYTLYVSGQIQKIKAAESKLEALEEGRNGSLIANDEKTAKDFRALSRRRKSIGNIKTRQIFSGNELKDVEYTNKIHYAYYLNIIARMILEGVFIYFGYILFLNMDPDCKYHPNDQFCPESGNPFYFLWLKVPASYRCMGDEGSDVYSACTMHVRDSGYVPCFISRPFEKTVFLCYMSILSAICFMISAIELVVVTARRFFRRSKAYKSKPFFRNPSLTRPRNESVFYGLAPSAPTKNFYDDEHLYPSLGVPIRINHNRYEKSEHQNKRRELSNDEDENKDGKENFSDA